MTKKLKVAFIGQPEYFSCHYENDLDEIFNVAKFPFSFSGAEKDYAGVVDFKADINFFFRGEFIPSKILSKLEGVKVNISTEPFPNYIDNKFNFTADSVGRFKTFLSIFDLEFDYVFHYDETSETFFKKQGVRLSGFFPLPIATKTYKPSAIQKNIDIFFIGRSTEHREKFFGAVKRDMNFLHVAHGLYGKNLLPYINASKIVLNVHAENEISWEPRVQMLLACGCLVVSEPISPNKILRPGKEFIEARTPFDFYDTCRDILSNPKRYEAIQRSGYSRVQENLAANDVWPKFIQQILDKEFISPVFNRAQLRLNVIELCTRYNGFEHLLEDVL